MNIRFAFLLAFVVLLVGSLSSCKVPCRVPQEFCDEIGSSNFPTVTASPSSVAANNYVEVSVKQNFRLPSESPYEERSVTFDLGVCIIPEKIEDPDECSQPNHFVVPNGISVREGEVSFKTVELRLKRGQEVAVEHKFSFTSLDPRDVSLVGVSAGSALPIGFSRSLKVVPVTFN